MLRTEQLGMIRKNKRRRDRRTIKGAIGAKEGRALSATLGSKFRAAEGDDVGIIEGVVEGVTLGWALASTEVRLSVLRLIPDDKLSAQSAERQVGCS